MRGPGRPTHTLRQIFAIPVLVGVSSAIGLTTALVGDDVWDWASWPLLGLPVSVCCWYGWLCRQNPPT